MDYIYGKNVITTDGKNIKWHPSTEQYGCDTFKGFPYYPLSYFATIFHFFSCM